MVQTVHGFVQLIVNLTHVTTKTDRVVVQKDGWVLIVPPVMLLLILKN